MDGPADLMQQLAELQRNPARLPPVHLWNPPLCDNVQMRIDRQGRWYYMDSPIGRKAMARLFSTLLRLDDDGCYYLVTPAEKVLVEVEDRPFVVTGWDSQGQGRERNISFQTSLDQVFALDSEHPLRIDADNGGEEPAPRVVVRGNLEALLARSVFYQLAHIALDEADRGLDPHPDGVGLYSSGCFFPLAT